MKISCWEHTKSQNKALHVFTWTLFTRSCLYLTPWLYSISYLTLFGFIPSNATIMFPFLRPKAIHWVLTLPIRTPRWIEILFHSKEFVSHFQAPKIQHHMTFQNMFCLPIASFFPNKVNHIFSSLLKIARTKKERNFKSFVKW